jgi:hypothetical protein
MNNRHYFLINQAITNESSDNKEADDKKKMEEDEAKKIVESITDSITSGEKKDIEESTRCQC